MQSAHWYMDIFRDILSSIDSIVYGLINTLYQLFAYISKMSIISFDAFEDVSNRIYLILGIVMLFKVAFSLISYLANPDELTDSKKGIGGVVQRIIVSLAMLMFVPTIFNLAYRVQAIVIEDNILGNFVLGTDKDAKSFTNTGSRIGFTILQAFYYEDPVVTNYCKENNSTCMNDAKKKTNYKYQYEYMEDIKSNKKEPDIDDYFAFINEEVNEKGDPNGSGYYTNRYNYFITTIAGVVMAWIFLGFCFDVAIRSVKLSALQLIAPIPILSYIEPKKGEGVLKKWISTCMSTYLSLFIKLVLIYFVLFICNEITESGLQYMKLNEAGEVSTVPLADHNIYSNFARVLVYIGLFMFASKAPKLFSDIFGINIEDSFGMKVAKGGLVGTGLAASLAGTKAIGEAYKSYNRSAEKGNIERELASGNLSEEEKDERLKRLDKLNEQKTQFRRAITTGITSGAVGGMTGAKLNLKGFQGGMTRANSVQKRRGTGTDKDGNATGVGLTKEIGERTSRFFGVEGEYGDFGKWKGELRDAQNKEQNLAQQEEFARRNLASDISNLTSNYDIPADTYANLADTSKDSIVNWDGLISEQTKVMQERRNELQQRYDSMKGKNSKDQKERLAEIEKLDSEIEKIRSDFGKVKRSREYVQKMDELHQAQKKKTDKVKKQYEAVNKPK